MTDLGPHANFIILAYLGVAIIITGLIVTTLADAFRQKSRLKALEDKGIHRRSAKRSGTKT